VRPATAGRAPRTCVCRHSATRLAHSRPDRMRLAAPRRMGRRLRNGQVAQRIPGPASRKTCSDASKVVALPVLGGLHHGYRAAA
jgi:hypothetical protein